MHVITHTHTHIQLRKLKKVPIACLVHAGMSCYTIPQFYKTNLGRHSAAGIMANFYDGGWIFLEDKVRQKSPNTCTVMKAQSAE
jgi:hypothetical protein